MFEKKRKNRKVSLYINQVNRFFQLEGYPHIFAIGDVTALSEEKTSERALVHGELVAQHIKSVLKRKAMREKGYIAKPAPCMSSIYLSSSFPFLYFFYFLPPRARSG